MLVTTCILLLLVIKITIAEEDPIISINNGRIRGRVADTVRNNQTYYAFQGIPYAEPPRNELRFAAPQPAQNWDGILETTIDGSECKQVLNPFSSENCLFINVFTPSLLRRDLPVMVWIHGGGFSAGNSRYNQYGPDYFLENDVIVVTFNYRLGIFGFYTTEDAVAPGNWGLKDQVLALKWVNQNIAYFGGNPNQVTLFGHSAGSASANYLIQSPLATGLFQGAILQSGTTLCPWSKALNKRQLMFKLGALLGIETSDSKELLEEMKKVGVDQLDIVSASLQTGYMVGDANPLHELIYSPVIEPEGPEAVITQRSYEQLEKGNFNRVPIIMGYTSQESLAWYHLLIFIRPMTKRGFVTHQSRFAPRMNINGSELTQKVGEMIAKHYHLDTPDLDNRNILQIISDIHFVRPINRAAHLYSKYAPVFLYRYSYHGDMSRHYLESPGEGHENELPFLFYRRHHVPTTERDILTSNRMLAMWTNFAKTQDPTPDDDPLLENIVWPSVTPKSQSYLNIDEDLRVGVNPDRDTVSFWNVLYDIYGNRPYDTY